MSKHRKEGPTKVTKHNAITPTFELYPIAYKKGGLRHYGDLSGLSANHSRALIQGLTLYSKDLREGLEKAQGTEHEYEETLFYSEQLLRVNELLFAIKDNYAEQEVKDMIHDWLGYPW